MNIFTFNLTLIYNKGKLIIRRFINNSIFKHNQNILVICHPFIVNAYISFVTNIIYNVKPKMSQFV